MQSSCPLQAPIPLHYRVEKYDEVARRAYIPLPWYGPKAHTIGSGIPSEQREACTLTSGRGIRTMCNVGHALLF